MQLVIKTLFHHVTLKKTLHLQTECTNKTEATKEENRYA